MPKTKTAAAKESEKRRRQRQQQEQRMGLVSGALAADAAAQPASGSAGPAGGPPPPLAAPAALGPRPIEPLPKARKLNLDRELGAMLSQVRLGNPEGALLTYQRACGWAGVQALALQVKNYASLVSEVALRTETEPMLRFMDVVHGGVCFDCAAASNYIQFFSRVTVRELLEDCRANIQRAATVPARALETSGGCVARLSARSGKGGVELELEGQMPPAHTFQKGDYTLVTFPYDGQVGDESSSFEAEVTQVLPFGGGLVVRMIGVAGEKVKACLVGQTCRIDKVANKVTYGRSIDALRNLCGPAADGLAWLRRTLLAASDPATQGFPDVLLCQQLVTHTMSRATHSQAWASCNASQSAALNRSVNQRLSLIQGPPGTGKTRTAVWLMRLWVEGCRGPVLATADSNIAVDNLLAGCVASGLRAIRVGRPEAIRPELEEHALEVRARQVAPQGASSDEFWRAESMLLRQAQVVCATCSGAASGVLEKRTFSCVIVDEAAQATEPVTIIPLCRGGVQQVVLIGDHRQLPPTVCCRQAELEGLAVSLFERLAARGLEPQMLCVQYRMHPAIAAYPSQAFYDGRLHTGVGGQDREPPAGFPWPAPRAPVAFVPVQGAEAAEGLSQANMQEVALVADIVSKLLAAGEVEEKDIGVISPYAAQVRHIRRRVGGVRAGTRAVPGASRAIEVSSVDGFQGREKEVIIVSTVRANLSGDLGFVRDLRRMNVTLTRARRGLIVVGHPATLKRDMNSWGTWVGWCFDCGLSPGTCARSEARAQALASLHDLPGPELEARGSRPWREAVGDVCASFEQQQQLEARPWKARRLTVPATARAAAAAEGAGPAAAWGFCEEKAAFWAQAEHMLGAYLQAGGPWG